MSEEGGEKKNLTRRTIKLDCFKEGRLPLLHTSHNPRIRGHYKILKLINLNSKLQINY